jgi:hypothetical protein
MVPRMIFTEYTYKMPLNTAELTFGDATTPRGTSSMAGFVNLKCTATHEYNFKRGATQVLSRPG